MQYPKCYWIWNYRQWLLEEAEKRLDKAVVLKLWEEELGLVGKMLVRDERNFHGWSYRRFVVGRIEALRSPEEGTLVEQEFEYTETKIRAKLENFSALHYRATLLPRLLQERGADGATRRKMLQSELDLMETALVDAMNQSAWFYHQFLMTTVGDDLPVEQRIVQDLTTTEQLEIYEQELERIKSILEDEDDSKWVYEALISYALAYRSLGGSGAVDDEELRAWIRQLYALDPMRTGRWRELEASLNAR